jgi:hypothetical protein
MMINEIEERFNEMNELINEIEFLVNYYKSNNDDFDEYNYIFDLETSINRFIYLYNQH